MPQPRYLDEQDHHQHDLSQPALDVQAVSVRYDGTPALTNISVTLSRGERIAVIGPNGAGKSTLFNVISGVLKPTAGQVTVYGSAPDAHACIAYVPQRNRVDWHFPANVADVVMMGRVGRIGLFRWPGGRDKAIVNQALTLVGMSHLTNRQIGELSGGQQQRVFIARALAQEADLLLMDEPLSGLDIQSHEAIFSILDTLRERKVTVLVATHNINLAAERFDRLMLLQERLIGFGPPASVFTPELLSQAYGSQLHLIETPQGTVLINEAHYPQPEVAPHA
jgi:ABC-type Mn2+/Zn2+ transport system ATPase subunit